MLTCKRNHIKMRDYMDRRVTPPKRVTSPIWGTPPPCKEALTMQFPIKRVSTSKSLGVHIDGNLFWECHIDEISKKIASGISAIKRC